MKKTILFFFILLIALNAFPANDNTSADAHSLGLGGSSVVIENVYANFNNQALLALIETPTIATSFVNQFSLNDARVMAALPFSYGTIGLNVGRYGSSLYSELKAGVSFSRCFGDRFSASLQADMLSVMPSPNETSIYAFSAEIGLWANPIEDLTIGFHLYNFINAKYETLYYDELIPVNMTLGLGYSIFDNFLLTAEIENSSIHGTSVRAGMEYYIVDQLVFRTGAASNPALASIGLGLVLGGFRLDIAGQAVRYIGRTGAVSLSYAF